MTFPSIRIILTLIHLVTSIFCFFSDLNNVTYQLMDACDVPADMVEGYDLVILFDVYHDVPYPQQLVDGACKLLKKGGQFYMFDVDLHERVTDNKNNDRKYETVFNLQ